MTSQKQVLILKNPLRKSPWAAKLTCHLSQKDSLSQLLQVALKQKVESLWDLPVELQEQIYSVLSVKDKLVLGLANKKLQK